MDLGEIGCEDGRWIELAQDRFQCWALVLEVLNQDISVLVNIRASGTASGCRRLHPYRRITSLLSVLSVTSDYDCGKADKLDRGRKPDRRCFHSHCLINSSQL